MSSAETKDRQRHMAAADAAVRANEGRANAVSSSADSYRGLFESIDEGSCVIELCEHDGQPQTFYVREVNPSFRRITGIPDGKNVYALFPDADASVVIAKKVI